MYLLLQAKFHQLELVGEILVKQSIPLIR